MTSAESRNWFSAGGAAYARFRPSYPETFVGALADLAPSRELAVDVGCGSGQLTVQLAEAFEAVVGVDPSADQLAHAASHARVQYRQAPAEHLPVTDGTATIITAAQAAHWFDLPAFYEEVRRIAAPGAVLALITYGRPCLEAPLDARFEAFYRDEIGPYWPPERKLVDDGYRSLAFPFRELSLEPFAIEQRLRFADFLGYLSTWSAVRALAEAHREELLEVFASDLATLWGPPEAVRQVTWPIHVRLGTV